MSYQVLARRLRPTGFGDLVGQDHVVRALVHGLETGRLHHAYLFTGTRGVGKTTVARILARCLNCEAGVGPEPCGECTSCVEISEGRHVDLIEVDAASRTKVDDTRELLDNVQYLPTRGRYKVYLIDEVHMLSASSFNALLKTLEEPPEHVKFLLATTDPRKVPLTVLSRCLQLQLKNLLPELISDYLAKVLTADGIEYDEAALEDIARAGRGSMRDALSITDQAIAYGGGSIGSGDVAAMLGGIEHQEMDRLVDALLAMDAGQVLDVAAELATRAVDFTGVLAALAALFHDAAVGQAIGGRGMAESGLAARVAAGLSPEAVQLYYQIVVMGQRDLHLAPDPQIGFEMTLLRMLAFEALPPPGATVGDAEPGSSESASRSASAARVESSAANGPASNVAPVPGRGPAAVARSTDDADPSIAAGGTNNESRSETPDAPERSAKRDVAAEDAWFDLIDALPLAGVARMLAEHSLGRPAGDDRWHVVLDTGHDTLLNDAQIAAVERALTQHLGREISIDVVVGDPGGETPAERRERVAAERKQRAIEALQADPNVQTLMTEFDGQLDVDSVKSLE